MDISKNFGRCMGMFCGTRAKGITIASPLEAIIASTEFGTPSSTRIEAAGTVELKGLPFKSSSRVSPSNCLNRLCVFQERDRSQYGDPNLSVTIKVYSLCHHQRRSMVNIYSYHQNKKNSEYKYKCMNSTTTNAIG